jgi:D-3-phosphoglycerate dehydrogenase
MSLARNIPAADASMKAGRWDKKAFVGVELRGKTLGILGLGRIGTTVARRALGLGMRVVAHDPFVEDADAPDGVRMAGLDEMLAESDVVSVHAPLTDETRHLLDRTRLGRLRRGALLVQAARGGIVDEEALCDLLESGHLGGAAVDVYESEPLAPDHRLRRTPRVVLTPHLGASTREATRNVALDVARQVVTCLRTGVALNGVNVPRIPAAQAAEVAPYLSLTRNLAAFLAQVHPGRIESLRLTLQGALPASATPSLTAEMIVGALRHRSPTPVTAVNALAVAGRMGVRVHAEASTLKRDFVNLVRVEALIDGMRHFLSGTVLGRRHGRMVELDEFLLDAIPEGPLLVTFHEDRPGVIGAVGTVLGAAGVNLSRLQVGAGSAGGPALGIYNLSAPPGEEVLAQLGRLDGVIEARLVL